MLNNENKTNKQTKVGTLQRPFASELSALYNRKSTRTHTQPQANPDLKNKTKQNTKKKKTHMKSAKCKYHSALTKEHQNSCQQKQFFGGEKVKGDEKVTAEEKERKTYSLFHLLDSREHKGSSLRMFSVEAVSLCLLSLVPAKGTCNLLTQTKYRQVSGQLREI